IHSRGEATGFHAGRVGIRYSQHRVGKSSVGRKRVVRNEAFVVANSIGLKVLIVQVGYDAGVRWRRNEKRIGGGFLLVVGVIQRIVEHKFVTGPESEQRSSGQGF